MGTRFLFIAGFLLVLPLKVLGDWHFLKSPFERSACYRLFAEHEAKSYLGFHNFKKALQDVERFTEKEIDTLLERFKNQWEIDGSRVDYKYSRYIGDDKAKHLQRYISTYTTHTGDQKGNVVVQLVRKTANSSAMEEKRRILRILIIQIALDSRGHRPILLGFTKPEKLIAKYRQDPPYWEFDEHDFGTFSFALISKEVDSANNFKGRMKAASTLFEWSEQDLRKALKSLLRLEKSLRRLHLTGENLQYLVTYEGVLIPVQLDRLRPMESGEDFINLEKDRELLKALWHESKQPGKSGWYTL